MKRRCQYCETEMPVQVMRRDRRGYYCKSDIPCFNRLLLKFRQLKKVLPVGAQMANACYNLGNATVLHPDDRNVLRQLHQNWDSARRGA